MSQAKILSLDTARLCDETTIGPKAASLVRLSQIGLAVPDGFCITGTAFREHLEQNNLTARIKSAVDELTNTKLETKAALLSSLRQAVVEAPPVEEIRSRIENHYLALGADLIAVRSSGTAEDLLADTWDEQAQVLNGLAVSPGVTTGKARVILRADTEG